MFGIAAKMDLAWLFRDTKYAIIVILADVISNLSTVSSVYLIALRFDGIGGMSSDEVLFMMAFSTLVTGTSYIFGSGNNFNISRIIGRGQLEHMFQQPNSLSSQLATMGFYPFTGGTNLYIGIILVVIAANRVGLHINAQWILMLFAYQLTALVIMVARSYLVSTAAFYAPVAAEEISSTATDDTWFLSTFPLSGMPAFIQIPLITLPFLPDGLLAWFPAMCLLGKPPLGFTAYYPMLFALVLSSFTAAIFRKGMKYYVQKGSNRYVNYGFRN